MAQQGEGSATSPVTSRLVQKLVTVNPAGKEVLQDVDKVKPGDRLEYQLSYTNNSKDTIRGLTATLPVPLGTSYLANSAVPAPTAVSLDGAEFSKPPLKRKVEKNGKTFEEDVPPQEYRALRWTVGDLLSDKSVTVKARIAVNAADPVPVPAKKASATGTR